jgi:hypothetical protein
MTNYYQKYLKYKIKYLELKGGTNCEAIETADECTGDKKCIYTDEEGCIEKKQNVYIPYFHSCHLDEFKQIPEGCILVNTSSCGLSTAYHDNTEKNLRDMFEEKDEKLRDPITNRDYIEDKLKVPISIHTSTVNNNYLDMSFGYNLFHTNVKSGKKKDGDLQLCSGLYSINTGLCNEKVTFGDGPIHITRIGKLYKNAVFPTQEDILQVFHTDQQLSIRELEHRFVEKYGELKLSTLLEKFPGIYYIMSCRPPCKEEYFEATKAQRQQSLDELPDDQRKLETEKIINNYIEIEQELLEDDVHFQYLQNIIESYIEKYGKNDFISLIEGKIERPLKKMKKYIKKCKNKIDELNTEKKELESKLSDTDKSNPLYKRLKKKKKELRYQIKELEEEAIFTINKRTLFKKIKDLLE